MRTSQLCSYFLATALLTTIATIKAFEAETEGTTRWRGGGFGMYSEINWQERIIWISSKEKDFSVNSNALLKNPKYINLQARIKRVPSQKNMRELAQLIGNYTENLSIIIQVWKPEFNLEKKILKKILINEYHLLRN